METFAVLSPVGGEVVKQGSVTARVAGLDGKTVCELWNGVFKGDVTFPMIRELLAERFPTARIVPFTEFPFLHGGDNPTQQKELAKALAARAKALGCDALISGNGA